MKENQSDIAFDIETLMVYAVSKGIVCEEDKLYLTNVVLEIMGIDSYPEFTAEQQVAIASTAAAITYPTDLLDRLVDWAAKNGRLEEDTLTYRDLFNARLMGCLLPFPSEVRRTFWDRYKKESKEVATTAFYELSKQSNYIRTDRIAKNFGWTYDNAYGSLEITINLSKPENDPRASAKQRNVVATNSPKCLLCKENEGYAGRVNHPGRQNLRTIKLNLANEDWYFQYSPYIYYNEHCIVFCTEHRPMKIDCNTFARMLGFVETFPHYFISSNADLPIVGGSILSHDHFQGGRHVFPMEKASIREAVQFAGYEDVAAGIVNWPMSVLRLRGEKDRLIELADKILHAWIEYSDESLGIYATTTDGERHNTLNPVARFRNGSYELDLVLRNNRTDAAHPYGIFHPYEHLHNIKKENIGIIEVMGLAILPGRLKAEMTAIKALLGTYGNDVEAIYTAMDADRALQKHTAWLRRYLENPAFNTFALEDADTFIERAIGDTFSEVLEHCGVFKNDAAGREGFSKFIECINK